jgi:hypothetical protein
MKNSNTAEAGVHVIFRDPLDPHAFLPRVLTGDDGNRSTRHTKRLREYLYELRIGGAFDRRRLEPDEQRAVARPRDARFTRSRDHANGQLHRELTDLRIVEFTNGIEQSKSVNS